MKKQVNLSPFTRFPLSDKGFSENVKDKSTIQKYDDSLVISDK